MVDTLCFPLLDREASIMVDILCFPPLAACVAGVIWFSLSEKGIWGDTVLAILVGAITGAAAAYDPYGLYISIPIATAYFICERSSETSTIEIIFCYAWLLVFIALFFIIHINIYWY